MSTMLRAQMVVAVGQGRAAASSTTCCDPVEGSIANMTFMSFSCFSAAFFPGYFGPQNSRFLARYCRASE
jgi:hypothetical protein